MANAEKKYRKPNFSQQEIMTLLENVLEHKEMLMAALSNDITNKQKMYLWMEIARRVSACGAAARKTEEVREKWTNLKKDHRNRAAARKKTGSGSVPTKATDVILDTIIGRDSNLVQGIKGGGHDTFKQHQSASGCGEIDQTINSHLFEDSELNSTVDWKVNLPEGVTSTPIRNGVLPVPEEARDAPQNVQVIEVQVHTENDGAPDSKYEALDVEYVAPDVQCEALDVQPIAASQPQEQKTKMSALKEKTRDLNKSRASKKRKTPDSDLWNDYLRSEIDKNNSEIDKNNSEIDKNNSEIDKNNEFTALAKVARLWFKTSLGISVEDSTTIKSKSN